MPRCTLVQQLVRHLIQAFDGQRALTDASALAAAAMQGRYPGTAGEQQAASLIVDALRAAGVAPLAERSGYRDDFELTTAELERPPTLEVGMPDDRRPLEHLRDFCVNVQGAAGQGSAVGDTVWLGDLLTMPTVDGLSDKIGVAAAQPADGSGQNLESYLQQLRLARDCGLGALLRVHASVSGRKVMVHRREEPSLPSLNITSQVAEQLFGEAYPPASGAVGQAVSLSAPLRFQEVSSAGNVMATLGTGAIGVVLCAHYDHLGALPDGRFFPGAVDNASGVAVLLETARVLAPVWPPLPFRLALLFSTAEEIGLLGARRFVDRWARLLHPHAEVLVADELAPSAEQPLRVLHARGPGQPLLEGADGSLLGLPLQEAALPPGSNADHLPFVEHGVPHVYCLTSAAARDPLRHTVGDTADRLSADGLRGAGQLVLLLAIRLAARVLAGHETAG